jgi:hypothetical protein
VSLAFGFRAPVIASRRSSYDPDAVIAALFPELFLDSGRNVTLSGGGGVAAWSSRTATHNFVEAVEANQPTPVADTGQTVLNFNATAAQRLASTAESWAAGTTHTAALVLKPQATATQYILDFRTGRLLYLMSTLAPRAFDGAFRDFSGGLTMTINVWTWLLVESDATAGLWRIWVNGVSGGTATYVSRSYGGDVRIGGSVDGGPYLTARLATVAARTGAILSAAEKADLSRAIVAKYAAFGLSRGSLT